LDFDAEVGNFHLKIKPLLTAVEWKIYELLYIFHKTDEEAAETMEYSTTEPKRIPGYKQIKKVKNKILSIAKELVRE
jgi:hypothetical protein